MRPDPVLFSEMVPVAPFADVEQLTVTYRLADVVPIRSPVGIYPPLLTLLNTFIKSKWPSKDKLIEFKQHCEGLSLNSPEAASITSRFYTLRMTTISHGRIHRRCSGMQ